MKIYSFEVVNRDLGIKIIMADALFGTTFTIITGMYVPKLCLPTFFVADVIPFLLIIFLKKLVSWEEVTIKDNGFYIKSQKRFIEWKELSWYKVGHTSFIDFLGFGVANGEKISFPFYKKSKAENDWADFRKDLIHLVSTNCPVLKNYYQRKVFKLYSKYVFVSWILLPILFAWLGADMIKILAMTGILIGGTSFLLATIKTNQYQKLN